MPRTSKVECAGCPPLRALTFDSRGLIKVIEARRKEGGNPKFVQKWGEPDASKAILAVSLLDREINPLLAVARKSNVVEILNPLDGELRASISNLGDARAQADAGSIAGVHLFKSQKFESSLRSCTLLRCTTKGNAYINVFKVGQLPENSVSSGSSKAWYVCGSGNIEFSKVDGSETHALFGGKGVEINVWDLDNCDKIWTATPPPKNSLGICTPTWFTSATFLSKDDHRKLVAGTNNHQVRLYDISAQQRPVISIDFQETPIRAVTEDIDGHTVYVGNGNGDLASFDMRTGKLLGKFLGKCSGSIRSIVRHPELPVLASCGLDSYLRFWDVKTRQLLSAVFLKQHLTSLLLDSHFEDAGFPGAEAACAPMRLALDWKTKIEMKGGRKNLKRAVENQNLSIQEGQNIVQVVSLRGSNLIEVMDARGEHLLALFPAKFQKSMWIKRGSFVVVDESGKEKAFKSGNKVACIVTQVLFHEQVRMLQKTPDWPGIFKSTACDLNGTLHQSTSKSESISRDASNQEENECTSSDDDRLPPLEANLNRIRPVQWQSDAESDECTSSDDDRLPPLVANLNRIRPVQWQSDSESDEISDRDS